MTKAAIRIIVYHGWCFLPQKERRNTFIRTWSIQLTTNPHSWMLRSKICSQGNFYHPKRIRTGGINLLCIALPLLHISSGCLPTIFCQGWSPWYPNMPNDIDWWYVNSKQIQQPFCLSFAILKISVGRGAHAQGIRCTFDGFFLLLDY